MGHFVRVPRERGSSAFRHYRPSSRRPAEQLDAHRETPHMAAFAAVLDDLLDESGLSVHRVRRIA
jgi:hypothetical protein